MTAARIFILSLIILSGSCKKKIGITRPFAHLEGNWTLIGYGINKSIYSMYGYGREDDMDYINDSWNCTGYHYEFDSFLNKYVKKQYNFKEKFEYSITTRLEGVDTLILVEKYTAYNSAGTPTKWGTTQKLRCSRLPKGDLDYRLNSDTTISFYSIDPRNGIGSGGGTRTTVGRIFKLRKQ